MKLARARVHNLSFSQDCARWFSDGGGHRRGDRGRWDFSKVRQYHVSHEAYELGGSLVSYATIIGFLAGF